MSCRYGEARALLKHGVPVDATDAAGNTPLMLSCREGHGRLVKLFLRKGASLVAQNHGGLSAEQLALSKGHRSIVKFLHDFNAITSAE